ncbi:MAG: hypothetical protein ACE5JO_05510, partial [Candidatus Binatia bacterium]
TAMEIRQRVEKARTLSVVFSGDVAKDSLLEACPAVHSVSSVDRTWRFETSDTHAAVTQIVCFTEEQGLRVLEIETATTSLEDAFMTILRRNVQQRKAGP